MALGLASVVTLGLVACGDGDGPLVGPGGGPGGEGRHGEVVEGDGYEGVLLDAHLDWLQRADGTLVRDVTSFVPTAEDVARFEAALPSAAGGADLSDHVRQYTGVAARSGDDRHLVVAGICRRETLPGEPLDDWREGWLEVSDGGDCFFDATMDLATGEILRFAFHGQA
ncbi:MAG TPA: hypothetical protein VIL36_13130 [Acidimicrobiales bacterium]